jgi:hypothetical protein
MKYVLEYSPCPDRLTIHLNRCIATKRTQVFDTDEGVDTYPRPSFVKDLFRIDGVVEVFVMPYEVTLVKGTAFDWEAIIPIALALLSVTFDNAGTLEEKEKPIRYTPENEGSH